MDLTVIVTDAAETALPGATVRVVTSKGPVQGSTDAQGRFLAQGLPDGQLDVTSTLALYLDEQVTVQPSTSGSTTWDNPVCTWSSPGTLLVRLSRVRAAPTAPVSNSDLETKAPYDPRAAFTWIDNGGNPTRRYLNLFNDPHPDFTAVDHPLLPSQPTDGWGRISHLTSPVPVDPSRHGNLVWLEWGMGGSEPRLGVAIWVPRWTGPAPSQVDIVVFFSPNPNFADYPTDSYPWLGAYPYAAVKGSAPLRTGGPKPLVQPYLGLAQRYLFLEKMLVAQLLAAGRQAVVLFPVQPYGDWGPFGEVAGLSRLLREITHYLHRAGMDNGGASTTDQDTAPTPNQRFGANRIHQPPMSLRRIVQPSLS